MNFTNNNKIVIFISITIILDTAGFGIIFPVLPDLLEKLLNANIAVAAKYGGVLTLVYALMQFVFAPILGTVSDYFGRRPVLLLSLLGFSFDCFLMAFVNSYSMLILGRVIAGITGATFAVSCATIADITNDSDRTKYYGFINAAFGAGFIVGPLIGGLIGEYNMYYPFLFSGILGLCNTVYGYFFFPETNQTRQKGRFRFLDTISPVSQLKRIVEFRKIAVFLIGYLLVSASSHSMESTWAYFTIDKFDWGKQQIGASLTIIGVIGFVVQIYLVSFLAKQISDFKLIVFGLMLSALGFFMMSFADKTIYLWIGMGLYLMGSIQQTGFQSLLSKTVHRNDQGKMQGMLGSINGLTTIFAPFVFTYSFYLFTKESAVVHFSGIAFSLAGLLILVSLLLLIINKIQK